MEDKLRNVRGRYKRFREGNSEDLFALKNEVETLLKEVKARNDQGVVEELKEILVDVAFSIEESRCKCHSTRCKC